MARDIHVKNFLVASCVPGEDNCENNVKMVQEVLKDFGINSKIKLYYMHPDNEMYMT